MNIRVFGQLIEIVGSEIITIDTVTDTINLKASLVKKFPALAEMDFLVAVDKKQVVENMNIDDRSFIVLMPPFSGG